MNRRFETMWTALASANQGAHFLMQRIARQMSLRRIILGLVILAILGIAWFAYSIVTTLRAIPDAYAAWDAGTLVIEYLETHEGQWPRSWAELDTAFDTLEKHDRHLRGSNGKGGFIYGDIHTRVAIDWNADPNEIKQSEKRFRVVTRADGKEFRFIFAEPNGMIWRYLNGYKPD